MVRTSPMERAPLPELKITNDRLLVFVDDTGHEAFKGARKYGERAPRDPY
jgi:hypothetical protein